MAYINNGYKRAESITLTKYINGVPQTPVKYWITDAFGVFPLLSSYNYQILSDSNFILRRDSFISYVSGIETGVIISKEQFEIYDTTLCPLVIPTTTTTTTAVIPTTTTTTTPSVTDVCDPTHEYVWTAVGDGTYYREVETAPIPPSAPLTLAKADGFATYSQLGTRVINNTFNTISTLPSNTLWKNVSNNLTDGPLNRTGIWTTTYTGSGATKVMTPLDKWVGFSVCLSGLEAGRTYYIGIAADNDYRLVLDTVEILNTYDYSINVNSFQYWNLFPVVIGGGSHTLELYGLNRTTGNLPNLAAFGCEIYDNTIEELNAATVLGDLTVVFSASVQTEATVVQNLDGSYDSLGYRCATGSAYSVCGTGNCIEKIYCP